MSYSKLSRYSAWLAHGFAFTSLGLVIAWAGGTDTSAGFLGGFNWTNLTFNYHPVMMVGGLLVAGTEASKLLQLQYICLFCRRYFIWFVF